MLDNTAFPWREILVTWGPAGLFLVFLIRAHHDVVYKTFPALIDAVRIEMAKSRRMHERFLKVALKLEMNEFTRRQRRASGRSSKGTRQVRLAGTGKRRKET